MERGALYFHMYVTSGRPVYDVVVHAAAPGGHPTVIMNGEVLTTPVPPQIIAGTTFVPVRALGEALGAEFVWDGAARTVTIDAPGGNVFVLTIGSVDVRGSDTPLLAAPFLHPAGHTMVPLRFIAEAFGADVNFDPQPFRP